MRLGDFVDDMAIVGGWVCIPAKSPMHTGSTHRLDGCGCCPLTALNATKISEEAYATIHKILTRHGYRQDEAPNAQNLLPLLPIT